MEIATVITLVIGLFVLIPRTLCFLLSSFFKFIIFIPTVILSYLFFTFLFIGVVIDSALMWVKKLLTEE